MEEKLNAVTLRAVDYGESDKILTLFSLEKGVITATVKGVKKAQAKLKFIAEPFSFCEIVTSERIGKRSIIGAVCHKSYFKLSQNLSAYFCASVMAEFIISFFLEQDEQLFKSLISALEQMLKDNSYSSLIKFILEGLSLAGYGLDFNGCSTCGEQIKNRVFLDVNASQFLCEDCVSQNGLEFKLSTYRRLYEINSTPYEQLFDEEITDKNCLKLLDLYIYNRLGAKLKTMQFIA